MAPGSSRREVALGARRGASGGDCHAGLAASAGDRHMAACGRSSAVRQWIEIFARGSELNNIGLLVDFVELKEAADELVTYLDHKNLNELEPFIEEQNPSAENVARFVLERLAVKINDDRVQIYKVKCWETPTSVATYQIDRA